MPQTIMDLGKKVKAKYPGQYDDMPDDEVGRRVKTKFPGAYDDFADAGSDPNAAIKAQQAAKFPTSAEQGGTAGAASVAPSLFDRANSTMNRLTQANTDIWKGVGQGAATTLGTLGNMVRKVPVVGPALDAMPSIPIPEDIITPQNTAQQLGFGAERIAEFLLPSAKVAQATKGAGLLTRAGAEGLTGAGIGMAQGQTPEQALTTGAIGAAMPVGAATGGKLWQTAKNFVERRTTPRIINSLIEVNPKWLEFGRDPGGRIVKENIVAASKDSLETKVADKLKDAGLALEAKLIQGGNSTIKAEDIVTNALTNATKTIGRRSDPAFQKQLSIVLDDILEDSGGQLDNLTPLAAHKLKRQVGDSIRWSGAPYEDDINQALLEIYRGLNNSIDAAVHGAKGLQARWGDLYVGHKAVKESIQKDMTRPLTSGQGLFANVGRALGGTGAKTSGANLIHRTMTGPNTVTGGAARTIGAATQAGNQ